MIPDVPGIPTAKLMQRILEGVRRKLRIFPGDGIGVEQTSSGRSLWLDSPDRTFFAKLVGGDNSTGFSFRRVHLKSDDTWADTVAVDDKAKAFQANLLSVSTPRIVLMRDVGLPKEYRFWLPRSATLIPTCADCVPLTDLTATVDLSYWGDDVIKTVVMHYRNNELNEPDVGGGLYFAAPYWYSDPFEIYPIPDEFPEIVTPRDAHWMRLYWKCNVTEELSSVPGLAISGFQTEPVDDLILNDDGPDEAINEGIGDVGSIHIFPCGTFICTPLTQVYQTELLTETGGEGPGLVGPRITISDGPPPTPAQVTICAVVIRADCGEAPVSGATVELFRGSGVTPIDSGTTGVDGRFCFAPTDPGRFVVRAEDPDGCENTGNVYLSTCGEADTLDVEVPICCGRVNILSQDAETDLAVSGVSVYFPSADHSLETGTPLTTDGSGLLSIPLSRADTEALPFGVDGCTRYLFVTLIKTGYLTQCLSVPVACSGTPTAQPLLLWPSAGLTQANTFCGPDDCLIQGYHDRGYLRNQLYGQVDPEYQASGVYYPLGGNVIGPVLMTLDAATLVGSGTGSPLGAGPAIEYRASGTASFTPNSAITQGNATCATAYATWKLFVRESMSILDWYGPGYDPNNKPEDVDIPGEQPDCAIRQFPGSETTAAGLMRITMTHTLDFCIPEEGVDQDSGVQTSGDFRYRIQVQEPA